MRLCSLAISVWVAVSAIPRFIREAGPTIEQRFPDFVNLIDPKPATIDDGLGRRAHPPRIRCSRAWLGF